MEEFEQVIQRTVERLYEDERLRSHFTDDEAQIVLGWAERWIEMQVFTADDESRASQIAQNEYARIRQTVSALNALGAKQGALTLSEAVAALEPHIKMEPVLPRADVFKLVTQLVGTLWRLQETPTPRSSVSNPKLPAPK